MTNEEIWESDTPVKDLEDEDGEGFWVPCFIEQDINPSTVAAIVEGGCASGAYMPAVTYHRALATMNEHGDEVFSYIENCLGELPSPREDFNDSWAGFACFYVSCAVELWASGAHDWLSQDGIVDPDKLQSDQDLEDTYRSLMPGKV